MASEPAVAFERAAEPTVDLIVSAAITSDSADPTPLTYNAFVVLHDAAGNALTVARRAGLDETIYTSVENAADALEDAKSARDISRADQALTAAVSVMIDDAGKKLGGEDKTMLTRAADDFAEQGSFLRQEARSYNEDALEAEKLYEMLPTKFILPQPDVYEGI